MQLLFRASKNWAVQVHIAKGNSILGDAQHARELETWINSHIEGYDIESLYASCPS